MAARVIEIADRETGSSARVLASLGFNCFSWRPKLLDGPREMLWSEAGFEAGDKRPSGSGIPLLFPFPGRIGRAAFRFAGREYRLEPGDAFGNAIHGFDFSRADTNDDKSLTRQEFDAAMTKSNARGDGQPEGLAGDRSEQVTFEQADKNRDGKIDRDEAEDIDGFNFSAADADDDRSVSRTEFQTAMAGSRPRG